ncbi:uncharacterized protein [Eucyclogobius newberryi]|uniref:uncharacterized protein n=1 Tax=Eucyclogobius newberryi TaxID=166745 RepID=UPI003B5CB431
MNGAPTDNGPITDPDSGLHLGPGSDPGPGPGSDPVPGPGPGPGSDPGPDLGPYPGHGSHPDPASHDFLLSLMGGSDPFGPDLTAKPTMYQTGASLAVSLAPDPGPVLDSGTGHALLPALVQPAVNPVVDPAPPVTLVSVDSPDSPDSPDHNGNGRLTVISQSVTQRIPEVQTLALPMSHDLNGNMDAVTSFPFDLTASGLGLGPDATEPSHVLLHTDSVDHFTHLFSTGVFSQTELVTSVTETATDLGAAAVTDVPLTNTNTQPGPDPGPATESYNTQGPEGSENVELEDSC